MRFALDTNRYVDLARGDAELSALVATADEIWVPFVVIGELRAGFAVGDRGDHNERTLQRFLAKNGVGILPATEVTARHYAAVYAQLRAQGTPIPTNDMWIAATVIEHGLPLVTRDAHFRRLPQIARL